MRGTFGGLLAVGGSLGFCLAMSAVAALAAPAGGIGHAVACVVLVALPAAALLLRRLPETKAGSVLARKKLAPRVDLLGDRGPTPPSPRLR